MPEMATNYFSPALSALMKADGQVVVGTHMSPPHVFGESHPEHPEDAFLVQAEVRAGDLDVFITRGSGLFARAPLELVGFESPAFDAKLAFMQGAAQAFNMVLCELALAGVISSPASPVQMSSGKLVNGYALITGGAGGREVYLDRTVDVLLDVVSYRWLTWSHVASDILGAATDLRRASRLGTVSAALPELIVGAYSNLSRHHAPEAIVDGWVVIEQLLDALWQTFVSAAQEPGRSAGLVDTRTYTAAVRAELLLTAGILPVNLWEKVTRARKDRNALAHRATMSIDAASGVCEAMQAMVEAFVGETVAPPLVARFLTW